MASGVVKKSVTSVDSSVEWIEKVRQECTVGQSKASLDLQYVDIGPIREWGYPVGRSQFGKWTAYHTQVWQTRSASFADLYMVDGRFRVACFMQILLRCQNDALIVLHDFASRPHYAAVKEVAREIASAEDLSVFQTLRYRDRSKIASILQEYALDPA